MLRYQNALAKLVQRALLQLATQYTVIVDHSITEDT